MYFVVVVVVAAALLLLSRPKPEWDQISTTELFGHCKAMAKNLSLASKAGENPVLSKRPSWTSCGFIPIYTGILHKRLSAGIGVILLKYLWLWELATALDFSKDSSCPTMKIRFTFCLPALVWALKTTWEMTSGCANSNTCRGQEGHSAKQLHLHRGIHCVSFPCKCVIPLFVCFPLCCQEYSQRGSKDRSKRQTLQLLPRGHASTEGSSTVAHLLIFWEKSEIRIFCKVSQALNVGLSYLSVECMAVPTECRSS